MLERERERERRGWRDLVGIDANGLNSARLGMKSTCHMHTLPFLVEGVGICFLFVFCLFLSLLFLSTYYTIQIPEILVPTAFLFI